MTHPSADYLPIIYKRYAKAWRKLRSESPFIEKTWLDRFLDLIPQKTEDQSLPNKAEVLDLGCGDGYPIAHYLLENGCQIRGVDFTKAFIKAAKKNFKGAPAEWIIADMRDIAFDQQFSGIIAWDSYFHLPAEDQIALFQKFERYCRPGAPLLITTGANDGEAIGEFNGHPLYHASLAPDHYRQLFIEHGFGLIQYKIEDQSCGGRTIWLAKKR
ncbi:class I SAM-dependent methyltransferase [Ignatzschineria cameli]|uniref:SAM-dependent methyltransferase n=1 Tax=Ignatzschineria cameli TaxID=2182793 RepID=A0A2U2ATN4_9GAMM|nr:class I SAM-dependent methyltransferase [Ignatzschineria cameli]PWD88100.1 SAM-dependent methyltransferase [Ignatzschineria cameli]PWD91131.1 SAM-dependent methyltransferase [Ignatzschineria cameli]PWD92772.1 SAM-dependent methyltransferase [Ignatzschineria cameli]PWD93793.1 SAM-dependent methyltransferase [Ignatzschineria cameli]